MRNQCLVLLLAITVVGCEQKQKDQVISEKVVQPEQALITGQMFIVTKGRENVVLGDEKVVLLDRQKMLEYFKAGEVEWSNALAAAQAKVYEATTNLDVPFKAEREKLIRARKYHEDRVATLSSLDPEWQQAREWRDKVTQKLHDLNESRKSSDARKELDAALREQARLYDKINWPAPDALWESTIQSVTTDSQGRFKFVVPANSTNLTLLAKAERQIPDAKEKYWWLIKVYLDGKTTEIILSNHSASDAGVIYFDKSFSWYLANYAAEMERAKLDREFEEWENNLL